MDVFDWIKLLRLKNTLHSVDVSSSPNLPPLFVIVFWGETNRSSLSQMFFKIGVLKSFIRKHCRSIFLIKLQAWRSVIKKRLQHRCFPVKFAIFLRTPFFIEHLRWLLLNKPRRTPIQTEFSQFLWDIWYIFEIDIVWKIIPQ